jgi:hypothetical protein
MPNTPIHRTSGKLRLPASGGFQRWAQKNKWCHPRYTDTFLVPSLLGNKRHRRNPYVSSTSYCLSIRDSYIAGLR